MYIISSMSFETIDEVKDQLLRYGDQLRKDTLVYEVDIKKVFVANRDIRLEIDSKDKRNK